MNRDILVLNSGSSSIKFGVYDGDDEGLPLLGHGQIEGLGAAVRLRAFDRNGVPVADKALGEGLDHGQAMAALVAWGRQREVARDIVAVGHRVVHGGTRFDAPVRVDAAVLAALDQLNPLAPLHQPHNLAGIRALAELEPTLPQVACFDTAFHHKLPPLAQRFALPGEYFDAGIRRYGFHGLSYEYIAGVLPQVVGPALAAGRIIVAHLGNGASLCALRGGQSIETTMGFTALDGLPMGTRCGNLDPGVVLYLQDVLGMSRAEVADLLYHRSGLLGVSGVSNDMRELLASDLPSAREAIDLYTYRINRELGALAATLGGLDALVFTAGIGEHAAPIRARVCEAVWLGVRLDAEANKQNASRISTADSAISVWVIPTNEEWMIARHTREVLTGPKPSRPSTTDAAQPAPTAADGLSSQAATQRLAQYGPNEWEERSVSALRKLFGYFWGPIPWMIEVAAVLSAIVHHWPDLAIILVLLVFNAAVGFWQEYQAGNAIEQLKKGLALKARVLRDGQWQEIAARELVPDDVVRLRLGDVVPADIELTSEDYLSIDQSALTGESLPVDKQSGDTAYSGSTVKQGVMVGRVTATGMRTYFGKTAGLVSAAKNVSHFQKAVLAIGDYLIYLALALVAVLVLAGTAREWPLLELAQFALILTVASIPVALPAVFSVTMAVGALALSHMKAIVAKLEAIEEMAGVDILCSDKTGTLTQNRLTLGKSVRFAANDDKALVLAAALASKADEEGDAIDRAVLAGLADPTALDAYGQEHFVPFDPVSKRTEAELRDADGKTFKVSKGAPQVILDLCGLDAAERERAEDEVDSLAGKGFRTLGVARADAGQWRFLGLLSLLDPPREDAATTIAKAREHGIRIVMVTGDNRAIARQTASELGLGTHIALAERLELQSDGTLSSQAAAELVQADGFAEVFPEHKFALVKALQGQGHLVGMTGDGVNDAPALKQADVGIAVSGATDAARAAADLVLTAPGLAVIVNAVEEARRIFQRMSAYAIYRITETIRIMIFMVLAILAYNIYPITAVMIILLALLNDLPIMTIAKDNTWLPPDPVRWDMHRVLTVASVLGTIGVVESFLLLIIAKSWLGLPLAELQTVIFLKLAVAGHLTLLVARTHRPFFRSPYPAPILFGAILATQSLAVLIAGLGWFVTPIPWPYIGWVWVYCLVWLVVEDLAKLAVYRGLRYEARHHRHFLTTLKHPLHSHNLRQE